MTSNITMCLCFCSKTREYQYFDVYCPETSSCANKPLLLRCNLVIPQCMCQVLLGLKEVQMGPMTYNITRCHFCSKNMEYQYFDVYCPETSSCPSKPLLLRCNLVIPQCMCQVPFRLKEVQMGTHDFKYNKVPLFARKRGNINTSLYSSCTSKSLLLRCNLVILQCIVTLAQKVNNSKISQNHFFAFFNA